MDLRYLESFLAVAELGSTAAAARALHLTATAVAQRIHALEDEIGVVLLVRSGRTMRPTPEGYAIVDQARELLRYARDLRASAVLTAIAGELRVGILPTVMSLLVPQVLAEMDRLHPQLRLILEPGFSSDLYQKLEDDELDLAILVEPPFTLNKTFHWRLHHREPFIVIASSALVDMSAQQALRTQPYIRYHQRSWGGWVADRYLHEMAIVPNKRFDINILDAIMALVQQGCGISLIPDWRPMGQGGSGVVKLRLPEPCPERRIGLLWRVNSPRQRLIAALLAQLFGEEGPRL
jgi:DNA-binding transcriptional LysR family regulator